MVYFDERSPPEPEEGAVKMDTAIQEAESVIYRLFVARRLGNIYSWRSF
jgi:hypothetical protein